MASLLALPNELLLRVIRSVDYYGDAVSLALTTRRINALSDVKVWRKHRRVSLIPVQDTDRTLRRVVRILKNARLREYVHHLEVDCWKGWEVDDCYEDDSLSPREQDLLCQAIRDAGVIDKGQHNKAVLDEVFSRVTCPDSVSIGRKVVDILAATLVSACPNLISLSCSDLGNYIPKVYAAPAGDQVNLQRTDNPGSPSYLGRILQRTGQSSSPGNCLRRLRHVRCLADTAIHSEEDNYTGTDYYHLLNVVRRLPAIESVRFEATMAAYGYGEIQPPPRSANYSRLAFCYSLPTPTVLHAAIYSTKALTHLEISTGGRYKPREGDPYIRLGALWQALLEYQDTLEHLDLDIGDRISFIDVDFSDSIASDSMALNDIPHDPWGQFEARNYNPYHDNAYEVEWEDELPVLEAEAQSRNDPGTGRPAVQNLRCLSALKHLGLEIFTLDYLARGLPQHGTQTGEGDFALIDQLPPKLTSLRVYGALEVLKPRGKEEIAHYPLLRRCEQHLSQVMQQRAQKLPLLTCVEGVPISSIKNLHGFGEEADPWERVIEDWTDSEDEDEDEDEDDSED